MTSRTWVIAIVCVLAVCGSLILGQERGAAVKEVGDLTRQLGDTDPQKRSDAFYRLIDIGSKTDTRGRVRVAVAALLKDFPEKADDIKVSMTKALDTENQVVKRSASLEEDFTEYYGDLIAAVTSFRDIRSVKPLSDAVGTGHMVVGTLASFGQAALDPILEKMSSEEGPVKQGACIVLGLLLDPANPANIKDTKTRDRIKEELKKAAQDVAGAYIRSTAVEALAKLDDPAIVSFLSDIAQKDDYDAAQFVGKPGSFPVREAAVAALHKLGEKGSGEVGKGALDSLTQLGKDGSGSVKTGAVDALQKLAGNPEASGIVKNAAKEALGKLNIDIFKKTDAKPDAKGQAPGPPPQH